MQHFGDRMLDAVRRAGTCAVVGVDPFIDRLPSPLRGVAPAQAIDAFGLGVVEAVCDLVPMIKPQVALYEAHGADGYRALERLAAAARRAGLMVLIDGKRGDIGSTAEAYAHAALDDDGPMGADAATVAPYMGPESLGPFLRRTASGKGIFVLVRTSNPEAHRWQVGATGAGVAREIAAWIAEQGRSPFGDVGAVVGATLPEGTATWRAAMPQSWLLVPGFGAQGAGVQDIAGAFQGREGALIVSAREVLYPPAGHDGDDWIARIRSRALDFRARLETR